MLTAWRASRHLSAIDVIEGSQEHQLCAAAQRSGSQQSLAHFFDLGERFPTVFRRKPRFSACVCQRRPEA